MQNACKTLTVTVLGMKNLVFVYEINLRNLLYVIKLCEIYPWLSEPYKEMAGFAANPEELIGMFSEMLHELDRNTPRYMVDDMREKIEKLQETVTEQQEAMAEKDEALAEKNESISELQKLIAEQKAEINRLLKNHNHT